MTGHADHYLSRLDRLEREELDLALFLYQQAPMASAILARLHPPKDVDRVALTLRDGGPYLVLTTDGAFVTVLGHGMQPTGLHVVPRDRFFAAAEAIADLVSRRDDLHRRGPEIADALYRRPRGVTREEMALLEPFASLLRLRALESLGVNDQTIRKFRDLARRNPKKLGRHRDDVGVSAAKLAWGTAHEAVIATMGDAIATYRAGSVIKTPEDEAGFVGVLLRIARIPCLPLVLRFVWCAARMAPITWTGLRRNYLAARDWDLISLAGAIVAAGLRHKSLRTEAAKALRQHPLADGGNLSAIVAAFERVLEPEAEQLATDVARDIAWENLSQMLSEGHALRPATREDVPEAVLLPFLVNVETSVTTDGGLATFLAALPLVATAKAEDLYFPEAYVSPLGLDRLLPVHGELLLTAWADSWGGRPTTTTTARAPGRNEACSCGSGKKWKRCCGA